MKPITASSVPCDKPSLALGKRLSLKYMNINSFYNLKISSVATPNSANITEWILPNTHRHQIPDRVRTYSAALSWSYLEIGSL